MSTHAPVNVADARGLAFECKPGCGFCCTVSPLVAPHERAALPLAVRLPDGAVRIPIRGGACSALGEDRRCTVYDARPTVCRLYPYQVHAGRRVQVTVSLACPGISEGNGMEAGAHDAAALATALPGAADTIARAKATFAEFDRRMKEWNVAAPPDKLRAAFLPHAPTLALPGALPALFAGIAEGDFVLEGDAARAVGELFAIETEGDVHDVLAEAAGEAFTEPDTIAWVEPDLSWTRASASARAVELRQGPRASKVEIASLPLDWNAEATDALARYLERLMHRDHTEGASAWLVDASGYQATPASAFARVLGEASLHVMLRAGLLAAADKRDEIDLALARRGIAAYETAYHSLPTLGAIL